MISLRIYQLINLTILIDANRLTTVCSIECLHNVYNVDEKSANREYKRVSKLCYTNTENTCSTIKKHS